MAILKVLWVIFLTLLTVVFFIIGCAVIIGYNMYKQIQYDPHDMGHG